MLYCEMQMKELETKHELLKKERELECEMNRTPLENNDNRSQSTSPRGTHSSNGTQKQSSLR